MDGMDPVDYRVFYEQVCARIVEMRAELDRVNADKKRLIGVVFRLDAKLAATLEAEMEETAAL